MGVRNCKDIGDNLQRIISRLMANQTLVKLLYFVDKDPLSKEFDSQFLSEHNCKTYEEFCQKEIFEKLIKIVPRVGPKETANSILAIQVVNGTRDNINGEFKRVQFIIETFTPLTQWIIKDENLRPFRILGEIQNTLVGKRVNGLGKIDGGDFEINFLTEEISCYEQSFSLTSYD